MNLFKKLSVVTLASLALGSGAASASVIEHVHETMASGATFDGDLTFADHYASILGVDGYLVGGAYGNDHLTWNWNAHNTAADAVSDPKDVNYVDIPGELTDLLVDGDVTTDDYVHGLAITWKAPADSLIIDFGPQILTNFAGVDTNDAVTSVTVGSGSPSSNVPEPASTVLLGLGFAGLAAVRRRKA